MPLCVNRTFFTAWLLTSAAAGGGDPSSAPVQAAFLSGASMPRRALAQSGRAVQSADKSSVKTFLI